MPKKETVASLLGGNGLPYSPVVIIGKHHHFSGVIPNVENRALVSPDDIHEQVKQIFVKIDDLLTACGLARNDVYSATVMLSHSMAHFGLVNEKYSEFFALAEIKPRRKAFAVAGLPFGALVEIEFDAVMQD
jgi:enamine deaminase RidA (YjgF/YER057c/UK114 family)